MDPSLIYLATQIIHISTSSTYQHQNVFGLLELLYIQSRLGIKVLKFIEWMFTASMAEGQLCVSAVLWPASTVPTLASECVQNKR